MRFDLVYEGQVGKENRRPAANRGRRSAPRAREPRFESRRRRHSLSEVERSHRPLNLGDEALSVDVQVLAVTIFQRTNLR